jgi:hypothetical protein
MKSGRSRVTRMACLVAAMAMFIGVSVAYASTVSVDSVELTGANAVWDVSSPYDYGSGGAPCTSSTGGFTPVEDGSFNGHSDAFDAGLYLNVNGKIFDDKDEMGALVGQQLTVGPTKMSGLKVSRIERALSSSPTLRSLIRLNNPTSHAITVTVRWDSAMGSDGYGGTRSSSAVPFGKMTTADRWVVASDDPSSPSDPPVTFVLSGPGATVRPNAVQAPEATPSTDDDCVVVRYKVSVPAHGLRYLLFFTEMHDPSDLVGAINDAQKFNHVKVGRPLMKGIKQSVASKIVNWSL